MRGATSGRHSQLRYGKRTHSRRHVLIVTAHEMRPMSNHVTAFGASVSVRFAHGTRTEC